MNNQNWRPDWHDVSQYNFENALPVQYAWEFLRRNPAYLQDFESLVTLFNQKDGICNPRAERYEDAVEMLYKFYEKYHLTEDVFPPSPEDSHTPDLSFKAGWSPTYVQYDQHLELENQEQSALNSRSSEELVVRLDLRIPVGALLRQVEALIKEKAVKYQQSKRMRVTNFKNYLRLLDAEFSGASTREMAGAIYPEKVNIFPEYLGNASVRDALGAAKRLRDEKYYFIQFIEA